MSSLSNEKIKNNIPKVSIIVPCYNYEEFIIEALESVKKQTLREFECIIVDDGSTDNSVNIIKKWIKKDNRFYFYRQNNSGVSTARNKAISLSNYRFILPLDPDDKISKNYLEECYNVISLNRDVKLVYGDAYLLNNPKRKWNLDTYNYEDLLYKNMIHCTALFRKKDWEKVLGYDENLISGLEDWEFLINLLKNGGEVVKLTTCKFYYRIKNQSLNQKVIKNQYGYNTRLYIFEKHIDVYRKTNFYDMYYEVYNLRKKVRNPLLFLSFWKLVKLLIDSIINLFNRLLRGFVIKIKAKFNNANIFKIR